MFTDLALWVQILIVIIAGGAGLWAHEVVHYVVGYISGGTPYVSRFKLFVPHQVDYETPKEMSDTGVQLSGGLVVIFPIALLVLLFITSLGEAIELLPVAAFLGSGSAISMTDLLAALHPQKWRKYTAGDPIYRD